nr:leucine-rich repeat protein [uncultured Ruminococcus sp.]
MKARKFLAMFIAVLMIGTAVNFVPAITVSAKETNQQTVSASDDSNDEDYDSDDDYEYSGDDEDDDYDYDDDYDDGEDEYSDSKSEKDFTYEVNLRDDTAKITGYNGENETLTIPATLGGHKVTKIESLSNEDVGYGELETITIGNNVNEIMDEACSEFYNLKTVNIKKSVKLIGEDSFSECEELSKVTIEDGVRAIKDSAFLDCPKLKSVSLPNSISRIGTYSFGYKFNDDYKMVRVSGFTITGYKGSNVEKYTGDCGFTFKSAGQYKKTSGVGDYFYKINDNNNVTILYYFGEGGNVVIPEKINNKNVDTVAMDAINDYDYSYYDDENDKYKFYKNFDYITSLSLPKTLNKYSGADNFPKLTTLTVNNPLYSIEEYNWGYFDGDSINNFTIKGLTNSTAEEYAKDNEFKFVSIGEYTPIVNDTDFSYSDNGDGTAMITGYRGEDKDVTIPATINGFKITKIYSFCMRLQGNNTLESVTIGNNVKEIRRWAFKKCSKLKTVNIGKSVRIIEDYAFYQCPEISNVNFDEGVKAIEKNAFDNCTKLKSVSLPNSVNRIGEESFGYGRDDDYNSYKIQGFTITGYSGSSVEKYANDFGFTFKSKGKYQNVDDREDFLYRVTNSNEAVITSYLGKGGNVVIPDEIDGHNVISIDSGSLSDSLYISDDSEYKNFNYITELTLSKNITYISSMYRPSLPKLKTITIRNPEYKFQEKEWGYNKSNDDEKIDGFTIKGYSGSTAEKYAKDNGFNFVSLDNQDETKTTVTETTTTETTTLNTTVQPTTTTSTTMPTRNVEYPTETAMEEPTYTVPTVADTNVYTESIKLSKTKVTLLSGKSTKLTVKLTPSNANKIIWQSSNPRIATVENGVVKANKKGQATITVKTTDGTNLSAKCTVTVKQSVASIKLNKTLITNKKGSKVKLKATVKPSKADNRIIKWQTSNKKVATVNKKGNVKITGKGYAIITCKSADGSGVNGRCVVNNSSKAKSIKLNKTKLNVKANKTAKLKATVKGKCKAVSFVSKNNKIATVNDSGVVTGIEKGKTTIIAKTMDGSKKSVKCTVTVTGHNFDSWKITKNSTCVTEGTEQRTCKSCKKTETRKIKKTSHTWESEYIVTKEPTCTDSGLAVIKCEYCDEERNPYVIPPLGHCYNESVVNKEANCTEDGLVTRVCKNCGNVEEREVNSLGHLWSSEKQVIKEPTCQETGLKAYTCLYCKAVSEEEIIPKSDHNFSILVKDECVEPTCDSQGLYVYKCADCDAKTTKVIASLGHDWNTEPTVDIVATCQSEGKSSIHCKRCDKTKDEKTIPKTAHNFANEKVIKQATLSQDGTKSLTCKNCGFVQNKAIPKIATAKLSATSYTYDGKAKKPTITVADSNGTKLAENISYTVTGSKQGTKVNEYTVTLTFKGSYSGTKDLIYKIVPKGNAITSLTSTAKNQITVKWSKQATETTGYVLYYATKEDLSDRKYVVIKNTSTLSQTVTGLTSNKKYYVAVRTIKDITSNGKTTRIYSTVSPRKTITVK